MEALDYLGQTTMRCLDGISGTTHKNGFMGRYYA